MNPTRAIFTALLAGPTFILLACYAGRYPASVFMGVFLGWMFVRYYRALTHEHR